MSQDSPYPEAIITDVLLPDVQQYVDTYDADHMNAVRAAIRDITATLGVNPHGDLATLVARLSVKINNNGTIKKPVEIIEVAPLNADFSSIQSAINSINDASPSKIYNILIYPGIYTENVVLKDYVNLIGFSPFIEQPATINPASGIPLTIPNSSHCNIANMKIYSAQGNTISLGVSSVVQLSNVQASSADPSYPVLAAYGDFTLNAYQCKLWASAWSVNCILFNPSESSMAKIRLYNSMLNGKLSFIQTEESYFEIRSLGTLFVSPIESTNGDYFIYAKHTHFNGSSTPPLYLDAVEDYENCIELSNCILSANSGIHTIDRKNGTGTINLKAIFCQFTHAFSENIEDIMSSTGDTGNIINTRKMTNIYPF